MGPMMTRQKIRVRDLLAGDHMVIGRLDNGDYVTLGVRSATPWGTGTTSTGNLGIELYRVVCGTMDRAMLLVAADTCDVFRDEVEKRVSV